MKSKKKTQRQSAYGDRLDALIQALGFQSQRSFASALGIGANNITEVRRSRSKGLGSATLQLLKERYFVNPGWLVNGEGDMFHVPLSLPLWQGAQDSEEQLKLRRKEGRERLRKLLKAIRGLDAQQVAARTNIPVRRVDAFFKNGTLSDTDMAVVMARFGISPIWLHAPLGKEVSLAGVRTSAEDLRLLDRIRMHPEIAGALADLTFGDPRLRLLKKVLAAKPDDVKAILHLIEMKGGEK